MYSNVGEVLNAIEEKMHRHAPGSGWSQVVADFPWYPTARLARIMEGTPSEEDISTIALFINHPLRFKMLTTAGTVTTWPAETISHKEDEKLPEVIEPAKAEAPTPLATVEEEPESETDRALPTLKIDLNAPPTGESLVFQPYHTVDYFASQGIRVDPSLPESTRFDTQLKSFTQWLKTMKKLNYQPEGTSADPVVDAQAKASVVSKEIVTEAMAEVLEMQGKHEQAIELYAKLTLLHPEKSAFFAARIQKIKEQQ